jgi:hypothetical protein
MVPLRNGPRGLEVESARLRYERGVRWTSCDSSRPRFRQMAGRRVGRWHPDAAGDGQSRVLLVYERSIFSTASRTIRDPSCRPTPLTSTPPTCFASAARDSIAQEHREDSMRAQTVTPMVHRTDCGSVSLLAADAACLVLAAFSPLPVRSGPARFRHRPGSNIPLAG